MNRTGFIRFGFLLSDGQATTFKKNLAKIVKLILFDCFGTPLIIGEIVKKAKDLYSLEFSDAEINNAIKSDRTHSFIETHTSNDPVYFTYTITPEEYDKLKKKDKSDKFQSIAERYVADCCGDCGFSIEEIKNIVFRYIYNVFNTDINTVLSLMDYKGEKLIQDASNEQFTEKETLLLNSFLNWDDNEKNRFVYSVISSCYDYCMMTVKKDNSAYASVFNGKEFYLDANIIFRLAGFNKNERRESVESFIRKCKECGIKIKYTNFTNMEIQNTLKHQVEVIRKLLNGQPPISVEAMKSMSSKYANLDFYSSYIEWVKKPGHKVNDYSSFLLYLKREVDKHLRNMMLVSFESYEKKKDNVEFKTLCEDFAAYKEKRFRGTYEGAIKTDIENYFYMLRLDSRAQYNNLLDKKNYFISADHSYINWTKEKTPGTIPTFVLPSVWYSLMLKFKGRTDNDYNAFCQFLNLRLSTPEDEYLEKKEQMLAYVLTIDESVEIKEEIIFDIKRRLSEDSSDIADVEAFVKESHFKITEEKIQKAVSDLEKQHLAEKEALHVSIRQQAQHERYAGYEEGKKEGVENGANQVIDIQAENIVLRNKCYRIGFIIIEFGLLVVSLVFIYLSVKGNTKFFPTELKFLNENPVICSIISGVFSIMLILISTLKKYIDPFPIDTDKVKKKLKNHYEKKLV